MRSSVHATHLSRGLAEGSHILGRRGAVWKGILSLHGVCTPSSTLERDLGIHIKWDVMDADEERVVHDALTTKKVRVFVQGANQAEGVLRVKVDFFGEVIVLQHHVGFVLRAPSAWPSAPNDIGYTTVPASCPLPWYCWRSTSVHPGAFHVIPCVDGAVGAKDVVHDNKMELLVVDMEGVGAVIASEERVPVQLQMPLVLGQHAMESVGLIPAHGLDDEPSVEREEHEGARCALTQLLKGHGSDLFHVGIVLDAGHLTQLLEVMGIVVSEPVAVVDEELRDALPAPGRRAEDAAQVDEGQGRR
mmetsp:Transcript_108/g.378  ORF Transcript_108/g.378 Transcript_108/m.378 type:complete len:303 (+) Transcript_108:831-1739(+)